MRVLLINTSERIGGAAIAASRLMESLKNHGIKAKLLVRNKQTDQITVVSLKQNWRMVWKFVWERIVIWKANHFKKDNIFAVDIANTGTDITSLPEFQQADVIHLHWINQGMLSLKNIEKILTSGKPVVWTMHDMWPCTGICHHARECTHYHTECHNCPFIHGGSKKKDLSTTIFRRKLKTYAQGKITFVAVSQWLEQEARKSRLLQDQNVVSILNPINTNLFKPRNKMDARRALKLPTDKQLLMFGAHKATNKRKGMDYLVEACRILQQLHPEFTANLGLIVIGGESDKVGDLISLPIYSMGYVNDTKILVELYNSADLYVTPSLEEAMGYTVMEAMACGTPCVGFNVGGIPEMIDHLHNGYIAQYKSSEDFANGIYWTLTDPGYPGLAEQAARKVATHYSENTIAKKYIDLYNKVTGRNA